MKNLAIILAISSTAALTAVACGDSDEASTGKGGNGSGGASGSTSTGGDSGSATGGTAGTPATGGASGSATGGASGSATGGSPATGGTGGMAGADGGVGAEGGNGEGGVGAEGGGGPGPGKGCPANEPNAGSNCGTRGLSCDFGDRVCRCAVGTGNWQCFDENGDCPAMRDPNGNCMGGMTACSYGEAGTCVCTQGNFTCDTGVPQCPAIQPTDGAGCNMLAAGTQCPYTEGDCTCQGIGGGRTWNCENDSRCPAMAPMANGMCQVPGLICDYATPGPGADANCTCNQNSRWVCN